MSESQSSRNHKPPVNCTPCRVTFQGVRYEIKANGDVHEIPSKLAIELGVDGAQTYDSSTSLARDIRREASRQRRNRNARERAQAMKDMGLKRGAGGGFGGLE